LSIIGTQTTTLGQEIYYDSQQRFNYVSAGLSIPIFFTSQSERKRAAKAEYESYEVLSEAAKIEVKTTIENADREVKKYQESLEYYEKEGLKNAQTIIEASSSQFYNGEIDYLQWVIVLNQAITIKSEYLDALNAYNKAVITLQNLNNI
jgi:cobalt-zinc-cadmium resistance protein CzcA